LKLGFRSNSLRPPPFDRLEFFDTYTNVETTKNRHIAPTATKFLLLDSDGSRTIDVDIGFDLDGAVDGAADGFQVGLKVGFKVGLKLGIVEGIAEMEGRNEGFDVG
jgi:hypothetical protein